MTEKNKNFREKIREILEKSLNNSYSNNEIFTEKVFNIDIPEEIVDNLLEQENFINWLKDTEFKRNFCSGKIFKKMNKETIKKILKLLPMDKLKEIYVENIPDNDEFLQELIENGDEKSIKIIKFLNYEKGGIFKEYSYEQIAKIIIDKNEKIIDDIINENNKLVEQILKKDESIKNNNKEIVKRIIDKDIRVVQKIINNNKKISEEIINRKKVKDIKIIKTLPIYTLIQIKDKLPKYILNSKEYRKTFIEKFIKRYPIYWNFTDEMFEELSEGERFYKKICNVNSRFCAYCTRYGLAFESLKPETVKNFLLSNLLDKRVTGVDIRYIPIEVFENLIKDLNNNQNEKSFNLLRLLNYSEGSIFENLKPETIEKILKILPNNKMEKIDIKYIPKDLLEKLLKEKDGHNIINLLSFSDGNIFKNLKPETIEKILKILPNTKIEKIDANNIPKDLLEKLLKDKYEQNMVKLLDYGSGYNIFKNLEPETVEKILKILPNTKIEKINANNIPKGLLEKLLKSEDGKNIVKLLRYNDRYNNIFKNLRLEIIEEILRILPNDKVKEIDIKYIPTDILINCIKTADKNKELYNNILFLNYSRESVKNNEEFKNFLNDPNNIECVKNFLLDLSENKRFHIILNMNTNILKDILLSLSKEKLYKIFADNISIKKFKELATITERDEYLKILTSLNYSNGESFYIEDVICNDKKTPEESKWLAKNFLLKLGEEKIKTFNNRDIKTILTDNLFKDLIDDNLKKELLKKLIKENYSIDIENFFENSDEFVEIIKSDDISQEEANKIDLSNFEYYEEESPIIVEKLLKECPNKLPKIDTSRIEGKLLFNCLKKGDLRAENIKLKSSNSNFLITNDKVEIVKKIIKNNNLFLKTNNSELNYNKETLEILMNSLTKNEIISFVKFYCKNNDEQEIEFDEKKLKDLIEDNNLLKKIEDDYFDENSELEVRGGDKSYLENRQENLYFLLETLNDKLNKRLNKLKKFKGKLDKDIELRKIEIEENINKLKDYIQYLNNYRKNSNTKFLCDRDIAKEILYFITERYSEEVLRRGILDYKRRIEPFVKNNKYLKNISNKITKEIEEALGILYNPYSSDDFKLKSQEILKKNIKLIGDKYKEIVREKGENISGSYLVFSTICEAKNINELSNALYATIRTRMANDYLVKVHGEDNGYKIKTNILYRGYTGKNFNAEKVSDILTSDPSAVTGRLKYSFWDMTYNGKINTDCVASGASKHTSAIGSLTSYSENVGVALSVYGAGGLLSFYCIPDNLKKAYDCARGHPTVLEFAGYDVPLEYRIFNIIFDGEVPKEENSGKTSDDDEEFKVKAVKFNKNMNFVIFRLNLNLKKNLEINYKDNKGNNIKKTFAKDQKNLTVTEEQLEVIIKKLGERGELIPFLRDQLVIERVFDKDKILGEETKKTLKEKVNIHEENVQKTLNVEKGIVKAQRMTQIKFKQIFNNAESSVKNLETDLDKKTNYYVIPDIHGSIDAFREDLLKTGLIINDGNGEYIYYKKDDYRLINPIYEKPINEEKYIKVPRLTVNDDFEDKVIQLGDLVDNHSDEDTSDSLACLATSVLLSRQLNDKYITLIGNHEIAKLVGNAYGMEPEDVKYEQPIIIDAIRNDEIKLMYHIPGTNIINSHVELVKNHIENFLNKIEEKKDFFKNFKNFDSRIERLLEIVGFEKDSNGKYIESKNKIALLDNNPSEEDLEDFTNIINDLFKYIVVTEYEKSKKIPYHGLTHSLIFRSLVANSRLYSSGKGFGNATNKLGIEYEKSPLTPEELGQLTFKGITNVIGHDATPNKEKIKDKNYVLSQEKYLNNARILFTDEWQQKGKARCIKIESDRKNNKKYYFYRQEDCKNKFIEGNFVELNEKRKELEEERRIRNENFFELASDMINENNFNNRGEKELFEIILNNIPKFLGDECPTLEYCNIKNSDKIIELSEQLLEFMKDNNEEKRKFINQLIDDNFFKNYNDEEIFNNCINEIDIYNRKEEIEQEERKNFFDLAVDIAHKNNFNNQKEKELFEIILSGATQALSDINILLNDNLLKNKIKIIKLSKQLIKLFNSKNKEERKFINQLIKVNFKKNNKKYDENTIFINCISETDKTINKTNNQVKTK